MIKYDFEVLC